MNEACHPQLESGDSPLSQHFTLGMTGTALVLTVSATLMLAGLDLRTLTYHEALAAQPGREVVQTGAWIVPTFAGEPRTNKPPGMMWLIAGSLAVFGERSDFAARLPAALSGVGFCWLLAWLVSRYCGRRIGILSGLLAATSYFMIMQGRLAEADMPLALVVLASLAIFARCNVDAASDESPRPAPSLLMTWPAVAFYVLAGSSTLIKGVAGPGFILLAALTFALLQRNKRTWIFVANPVGLVLFIAIPATWALLAWNAYPPIVDTWMREQSGSQHEWEWFWEYFGKVPEVLLPWFPFAVIGLWRATATRFWRTPFGLLMIAWFVPGMLVLMFVVPEKSKHYPIPLFGPWIVLAACGMVAFVEGVRRGPQRVATILAAVLAAGVAVASGLAFTINEALTLAGILGAVVALAGLFSWMLIRPRRPVAAAIAGMIGVAWGFGLVTVLAIIPMHDDYAAEAETALASWRHVPKDQPLYLVELGERQAVWYARPPFIRIDDFDEFQLEAPERAYVLTTAAMAQRFVWVRELDKADSLRRAQTEDNRLVLIQVGR